MFVRIGLIMVGVTDRFSRKLRNSIALLYFNDKEGGKMDEVKGYS